MVVVVSMYVCVESNYDCVRSTPCKLYVINEFLFMLNILHHAFFHFFSFSFSFFFSFSFSSPSHTHTTSNYVLRPTFFFSFSFSSPSHTHTTSNYYDQLHLLLLVSKWIFLTLLKYDADGQSTY